MIPRIGIRVVPVLLVLLVLIVLLTAPVSTDKTVVVPPENQLTADLAANRPVQALYQIKVIAAQTGWTADLARSAGNLWQTLGDLSQAVTFWELAAQKDPSNLPLAKQLAQTDLDLQRWTAAIVALNHLLELSPDDNWAHYHLGLLQAAFDPQQALNHLHLASRELVYRDVAADFLFLGQATADDPATVMRVGLTLATHKLWNYAELVFQYAADLAQPFPEALAYAGLARDNQGKDGSAQIEQAVTLAPLNAQVRYLQGLHLRSNGDNNGSLNALQQAANLDPLNPAFAAELGSAYQLVDQLPQAEYWLKQAVTLSKNDPRFQDLLTHFYEQFPTLGQ
jgi:tetratricopeptide (TPR) repeat protein